MSPLVQGIKDPDNNQWEWVHIEDFSPGIYDASNISESSPVVVAPLGASTATGTWCCMALPGGGLGPLPKLVTYHWNPPNPEAGSPPWYIVGAVLVPNAGGGEYQLLVMYEADNGTTHFYQVWAYEATAPSGTQVLTVTCPTQPGIFGSPYPQVTRASTTTFTKAGTPIAVWPAAFANDTHGNAGHLYVYPKPTARTSYAVKDLVTPTQEITGQLVCFYNRIIVLSGVPYTWPGGPLVTNENIGYTTPPNSYTLGNQQTVFAAEDPFGYGAWGSISTGELLFVKKQGGAVVVNGDVEFPTSVLYLPGVHPTGDFYGRSEASEQGLYYCSEHQGAWLWNGGNTSQKISQQLRDDFYDVSTDVIDSNNYGFYAERWGQTILFSGNWLYNEQQGSWWKLYPTTEVTITPTTDITQTGHTFFWWLPGTFGYNLFALSLALVPGEPVVFQFDNRFTAPIWRWTSLPIHVAPTANHRVDVREVVIRASCPTAGAKVKVQIATWAGTSTAAIGTDPTILRFHVGVGALALEDIEITLTGLSTLDTNTRQSPIIHSIDIAYAIRAHEQSEN